MTTVIFVHGTNSSSFLCSGLTTDRLTPDNPTDVRSVAAPHVGPFDRPELVEIFTELARH